MPYTVEEDWAARIDAAGAPFGAVSRYDTTYHQLMDPDTLVARVLSTSYIASRPEADRTRLAAQVRELVTDLGDTFDLPYVTVVYWCHRD